MFFLQLPSHTLVFLCLPFSLPRIYPCLHPTSMFSLYYFIHANVPFHVGPFLTTLIFDFLLNLIYFSL